MLKMILPRCFEKDIGFEVETVNFSVSELPFEKLTYQEI